MHQTKVKGGKNKNLSVNHLHFYSKFLAWAYVYIEIMSCARDNKKCIRHNFFSQKYYVF